MRRFAAVVAWTILSVGCGPGEGSGDVSVVGSEPVAESPVAESPEAESPTLELCSRVPTVRTDFDDLPIDDPVRSAAQNKAHNTAAAMGIDFDGSGYNWARERVTLYLRNATNEQIEELAQRLDDPSGVCYDLSVSPVASSEPFEPLPAQGLDDPMVVCGDWEAIPSSHLAHLPSIDSFDHPAIDALRAELAEPSGKPLPEGRWVVMSIGTYRAEFAALSPDGSGSIGFANRHHDIVDWKVAGHAWDRPWGAACGPRVPLAPGLGVVDVQLDPRSLPTPDSTTVDLLVTQQGCNSGEAMGDNLLGPQVRETEDAVLVAFAVRVSGGPAACPDNPPSRVTVELSKPLGERTVRDGLFVSPQSLGVFEDDWWLDEPG